jgi:acetyl-CoA C-acetyltransferase
MPIDSSQGGGGTRPKRIDMDAYILDTLRTPRGKAKVGGGLHHFTPIDLLTHLYQGIAERTGLDGATVGDVIIGCNTQTGEQSGNIGKIAALCAGWSDSIPGVTVNRFCASGLEALQTAALHVHADNHALVLAGGVESVSRVPMFSAKSPYFSDPIVSAKARFVHMGVAADLVATLEGFTREELDAYAVQSHQRAAFATAQGRFAPSLLPMPTAAGDGMLTYDENVRPLTTIEQLAAFEPSFAELGAQGGDALAMGKYPQISEVRHLHHRGNSPSLADGAGVMLVGSAAQAAQMGIRPRARIRSIATASVDPIIMLTAGQLAVERALAKAGLTPHDVDLYEFAEAFAALCVKIQRDLNIDPARFNVNGGTLALGHALGASGAILTATLLDEMERRDVALGVVAISGAAGLGAAVVLERV